MSGVDLATFDRWLAGQGRSEPPPSRPRSRRRWRWLGTIVVLGLVVVFGAICLLSRRAAPEPTRLCASGLGGEPAPADARAGCASLCSDPRPAITIDTTTANGNLVWIESTVDPEPLPDYQLVAYAAQGDGRAWTRKPLRHPSRRRNDGYWWTFVDLDQKPTWQAKRHGPGNDCSPSVTWLAADTSLLLVLLPRDATARDFDASMCARAAGHAYRPRPASPAPNPCAGEGRALEASNRGIKIERIGPAVAGNIVDATDPRQYEVRVFVNVPDQPPTVGCTNKKGWYAKPMTDRSAIHPDEDGNWIAGVYSGVDDEKAKEVAAFLVRNRPGIRDPDGENDAWFQSSVCNTAIAATVRELPVRLESP